MPTGSCNYDITQNWAKRQGQGAEMNQTQTGANRVAQGGWAPEKQDWSQLLQNFDPNRGQIKYNQNAQGWGGGQSGWGQALSNYMPQRPQKRYSMGLLPGPGGQIDCPIQDCVQQQCMGYGWTPPQPPGPGCMGYGYQCMQWDDMNQQCNWGSYDPGRQGPPGCNFDMGPRPNPGCMGYQLPNYCQGLDRGNTPPDRQQCTWGSYDPGRNRDPGCMGYGLPYYCQGLDFGGRERRSPCINDRSGPRRERNTRRPPCPGDSCYAEQLRDTFEDLQGNLTNPADCLMGDIAQPAQPEPLEQNAAMGYCVMENLMRNHPIAQASYTPPPCQYDVGTTCAGEWGTCGYDMATPNTCAGEGQKQCQYYAMLNGMY